MKLGMFIIEELCQNPNIYGQRKSEPSVSMYYDIAVHTIIWPCNWQ